MTDQKNQNQKSQPVAPSKGVDQEREKQRPDQNKQGEDKKTKE